MITWGLIVITVIRHWDALLKWLERIPIRLQHILRV